MARGRPYTYVKYNVLCACFLFLYVLRFAHSPKEGRAKVNEGSKYVFPVHEVPFGGLVDDISPEGVETPKNVQIFPTGQFPA